MAQELLGLSEDQMLGKAAIDPAWHFLHEDGSIMPLEDYPVNKTLTERQPLKDLITGIHRPDLDTVIWVLVNTEPTLNEQGQIDEVIITFLDITDRRRAEEALRKSEAKYRQLFDNSPSAIYQIDFRTGKFTKANDVFCELLGYSQKEITSLSPYDILTDESKQLFLERLNKMALGDKVPEDPEYEIIHTNGKRRWLKLNSKNIYDSEGLVGADVVAHDITERKRMEEALRESEEKYRLIAENMADVISVQDMNLRFTYISPSIMRLRGITVEEAMEQTLDQVMTPESLKIVFTAFEEEMKLEASGTPDPDRIRTMEVEEYWKDGSIIWVEISLSYLRDRNLKPVAILAATR
ncbi:MAG: PAS domain S-box protein, partial [Syntrophales bacterium LBB04]|nr:PAS domain S-box protein [Syntrophales bacterium LBB04]